MRGTTFRHGIKPTEHRVPVPPKNRHEVSEHNGPTSYMRAFSAPAPVDGPPLLVAGRERPQTGQPQSHRGPPCPNADDGATAPYSLRLTKRASDVKPNDRHLARRSDLNGGLLAVLANWALVRERNEPRDEYSILNCSALQLYYDSPTSGSPALLMCNSWKIRHVFRSMDHHFHMLNGFLWRIFVTVRWSRLQRIRKISPLPPPQDVPPAMYGRVLRVHASQRSSDEKIFVVFRRKSVNPRRGLTHFYRRFALSLAPSVASQRHHLRSTWTPLCSSWQAVVRSRTTARSVAPQSN